MPVTTKEFTTLGGDGTWNGLASLGLVVAVSFAAILASATVTIAQQEAIPATSFLSAHCVRCHGAQLSEAGLRIDQMLMTSSIDGELLLWKEILARLESRDMPPKGQLRPDEASYEEAVQRIRVAVETSEEAVLASRPRAMRRLNRDEYANTLRDLLGIRFRPGEDFPSDGTLYGFDTIADGLNMSPSLVEKYLSTASAVLDRAIRPNEKEHRPTSRKFAFEQEYDMFPVKSSLGSLGVYNGNAHMTFDSEGKQRVVYIGGPALFAYSHIDAVNNMEHAFNSEGVYRLRVTLTPQGFEPGDVASFTVLGAEKRLIAEFDLVIAENGKPVTLEAESYYDRSESLLGFEIQWTNGNFLQEPSRGRLLNLPFDGSDQNKPWWHINYRMDGGKRVEWKPMSPHELPFSYFEQVAFEITGPHRGISKETAEWLGNYEADHDASPVVERFLSKAFRRPVSRSEIERYVAMVRLQKERGLDSLEALKVGLAAALCSPHFLLFVEADSNGSARRSDPLNDHELASRLSYFLWSSCPDEELRRVADAGELRNPVSLRQQVNRMLADPKAEAFVQRFSRQWLNLDKLATTMPEPKLFPTWSDAMRDSSRAETTAFLREVLRSNRPITDFLSANWTMVNEDLAAHYELTPVRGRVLRKVPLPDARRGGLMTQAALLTLTSEATRTSPVIRGAYVLDRLFHRPPPPPPANVGSLIPDVRHAKSVREHLNIHRSDPNCAQCHAKFDGYGLVLENFDATGRWRSEEPAYEDPAKPVPRKAGERPPSFPIDTQVEMADGSRFEGVVGMKQYLLERRLDFARGLAERLMIYGCGRGLTIADRPHIESVVRATAEEEFRFQSLLHAIIDSQPFRNH